MSRSNENLNKFPLENCPKDEISHYSATAYNSEQRSSGSDSESGSGSSSQSIEAEWASHIEEDGSLIYLESYVSSTVKERQVHQAIKATAEVERKSPLIPPQKNLKRQTKLLGLLRRRPSVRIKSSTSLISDHAKAVSGSGQEPPPPKVTFRDNPSGEVRHVVLEVMEMDINLGRRATFCEMVLGILPGRFNEPPDSRVMVAGLVPGSQALKDGSLKIGDWLKEVNSEEVNWDNLDSVLGGVTVPSTLTLSVQKCAVDTLPHDDHPNLKRVTQTRLARFVAGQELKSREWSALMEQGSLPLHACLYLSLDGLTEESPECADLRYQFPSMSSKLVKVRGMLLTLCHSLQDVVGTPLISSTFTLHGVHYHTAFCREQDDVLLLTLPHFCISKDEIVILLEQVVKVIKFEFGTLCRAFRNPQNKDYLDNLFLMTLEDILMLEAGYGVLGGGQGGAVPPFTPAVPSFIDYAVNKSRLMFGAPTSLLLRDDFPKSQLEICLNELQSGDFGETNSDCEDCFLLYNIIGCSLFYKSHLLLSHLDESTGECTFLFLERHRLLQLVEREPVSQLVIWKRIFPTHHPEGEAQHPYRHSEIDHYLLVVAMNHFLLAIVVESGNVTPLMDPNAGPDPFLVDQAETTLYHLHSLHVHTACEESLAGNMIEIRSVDAWANPSGFSKSIPRKSSQGGPEGLPTRPPDVPSILKQKSPSPFDPCECERSPGEGSDDSPHSRSPCTPKESPIPEGEAEEGDSCRGDDASSDSDWRVWKPSDTKGGYLQQIQGPTYIPKTQQPIPLRLTAGEENVLLHLVQLDIGEGVIIMPHSGGTATPLHAQLLQNFHATVAHIHHVLHTGRRNKEPAGNYLGSNALNNVKEYGIMFECQIPTKNKTQDLVYWVVGRLFGSPYEREIYVALEDSVPQNMQEIAFKLALGTS